MGVSGIAGCRGRAVNFNRIRVFANEGALPKIVAISEVWLLPIGYESIKLLTK